MQNIIKCFSLLLISGAAIAAQEPPSENNFYTNSPNQENNFYNSVANNHNNFNNTANTNANSNPDENTTKCAADQDKEKIELPRNYTSFQEMSNLEEGQKRPTIRDEAFKQLLNKTFPLRPDQLVELRQHLDKSQLAVQTHPRTPPEAIFSTLNIDLSPGATPPVIRLANGFVTSMVFIDSTGQPWPVQDYSLGNPRDFNIQWDQQTNTMFIQSTAPHVTANLALRLAKLDTPLMISMVTGQKDVDYRVDFHVPGYGPNALPPITGDQLPKPASSSLLQVLDGVPPNGSIELKVSGNFGRAWLVENKLIFRTKLAVISPAWFGYVTSADGTRVYELPETPLILASLNGKPQKIEITGK